MNIIKVIRSETFTAVVSGKHFSLKSTMVQAPSLPENCYFQLLLSNDLSVTFKSTL